MTVHLGLDLGGTNIKCAVVARDGGEPRVVAIDSCSTGATDGPDAVLARVASLGRAAVAPFGEPASAGRGARDLVCIALGTGVGGGVVIGGRLHLGLGHAELRRRACVAPVDRIAVVPAELGPHAGAVGAALWAAEGSLYSAAE